MPKITWYESYTTICKYSAEISEEDAQLFREDEQSFIENGSYFENQELDWDKITDEDTYDFEIEEEE